MDADFGEFWRQLEWMGMQRHLEGAGHLLPPQKHRDGKPGYSRDLPRFFGYVRRVARRYQGFGPLLRLVDAVEGVQPKFGYTSDAASAGRRYAGRTAPTAAVSAPTMRSIVASSLTSAGPR